MSEWVKPVSITIQFIVVTSLLFINNLLSSASIIFQQSRYRCHNTWRVHNFAPTSGGQQSVLTATVPRQSTVPGRRLTVTRPKADEQRALAVSLSFASKQTLYSHRSGKLSGQLPVMPPLNSRHDQQR